MSYGLIYNVSVCWIPDGAAGMTVPSAQVITFNTAGLYIPVPGGDSPTQGNFNTALSGASSTPTAPSFSNDIALQIAAQLGRIQAFSSGGG